MTTSVFAFVVVLGVLIFFHELGHFLVARLFGVDVEKFSLGFGPRLIGKKVGITDYRISAIPLGGFVKMVGEEPGSEIDPSEIPLSFTHKHVLKRILIVAAGPIFNLLLAVIIFFGLFQISGTYVMEPVIGGVEEGYPAVEGGLKKGDRIVSIDGHPVATWTDMAEIISGSGGKTLEIEVARGKVRIDVAITPVARDDVNIFGEKTKIQRFVIGISSSGEILKKELSTLQAFKESISQTYEIAKLTIVSVVKIITGAISTKNLGGPIMIAEMAGQQAKAGAANLIFFIALLSINLAILNFLPIPILDGGQVLFFTIEAILGRPVSMRVREIAQQGGVAVLILLMLLVFYNDISRIFSN